MTWQKLIVRVDKAPRGPVMSQNDRSPVNKNMISYLNQLWACGVNCHMFGVKEITAPPQYEFPACGNSSIIDHCYLYNRTFAVYE